jgi:hypothetical protein
VIDRCEESSALRVQRTGNNVEQQVIHTTNTLFTTCSFSPRRSEILNFKVEIPSTAPTRGAYYRIVTEP